MMAKIAIAMVMFATFAGCFSVDVAKSPVLGEEVEAHVVVSNYGWNLFGCVPLVCGNENFESWCPFTFFRNEVRQEIAYAKLEEEANRRNCDLANLMTLGDDAVLFDIPVWEYAYAPIPWVLQYHEVNYSAVLVRRSK